MTNPSTLNVRAAQSRARRGVASVLAMMFLVIFGSLAAAMAVVAQGNLRTADSAAKVSRAMSAAETGLIFAARRVGAEGKRFVVEKGNIGDIYGHELWLGTYNQAADGAVTVLPPDGYAAPLPTGVVEAIRDAHLADTHWIEPEPGDTALPQIDPVFGTLWVKPIALTSDANGMPDPNGPYFRLRYELVAGEPALRVTSIGVDGDVQRILQMDFRFEKKIEYAVVSPNRIMIGKNVRVEGPLGTRFGTVAGELNTDNADPLVMRSDFYYLDDALNLKLDVFFTQLVDFDVDGDGRLRPDHPVEAGGLGPPELIDYDGDEYIDDFDLFLAHFDADANGMIVYDVILAAAAGYGPLADEFVDVDDQLARLIDEAVPDRDGDGNITASDTALGYRDGVIDANDLYAKVRGRLYFAIPRADWDAANGASYQTVVQGPIRPGLDNPAVTFETPDEVLRELDTAMFSDSQTWFDTRSAAGLDFPTQVAANLGAGGSYVGPGDPLYDAGGTWEDVPFGATAAGGSGYDWYQREIYSNMTFTNVRIPVGTNAVFDTCTFIGVTYVETNTDCGHENWNYAGARTRVDLGGGLYDYPLSFDGLQAQLSDLTPVPDTKVLSNNIRFHNCTFLGSVAGDTPGEYTHWRNKLQFTGNTRFYVDVDDPDLALQPDAAVIIGILSAMDPLDIVELEKSSILMPGWSIDVGNFRNEQAVNPDDTPKVKLKGTIVSGILDVRGTADVFGTLLTTFRGTAGAGPLFYGGLPDAFNTTIGYFGPLDGDNEGVDPGDATFTGFGEITLRYNPDAVLPDGIPWPIRIVADPMTYVEGGS